jgi:hypothetical protein
MPVPSGTGAVGFSSKKTSSTLLKKEEEKMAGK